jgi:hypothetical protein
MLPTGSSPALLLFSVFSPVLAAGAATAAIGVPLLIHLLFRKRYQVVPWAAIRFLLVAERRHRRRIDQWLLLALRILVLLLPLFAMIAATKWAEPLWQAIKPGTVETIASIPRTHHILVLDASLSMSTKDVDGQTRFEKAIAKTESLIRSCSTGDGFSLVVLDRGVQSLVPGPSNDAERVIAELRGVKQSHSQVDTASALTLVADIVGSSPRSYPRRQVTFVTDLQRSAWVNVLPKADATQPNDVWQRIFGRADVVVVDVAGSDVDNIGIADITLADPLPVVNSTAIVTATIANLGKTEKRGVNIQLLLGRPSSGSESLVPVEQIRIDTLPAGGRVTLTFGLENQLLFREKGIHVLQVKLTESDFLSADDERSIAIQVRDGLHTILVDGKPDPVPNRRAAWDLARALLPNEESMRFTPARPRILTPAEFLDPSLGDLSGVDCVYLCDIPTPNSDLVSKLEGLLKRGGGVIMGLGPNAAANRDEYNRVLFRGGDAILPGTLTELVTIAKPDDPSYRLAADEESFRQQPLFLFKDEQIRGGLISVPFKKYLRLELPPNTSSRRILSFVPAQASGVESSDRQKPDPAFIEWNRHRGRVVVFTSSFNEDWTDWPPLPTYLPFQQELLRFAAASPDHHTIKVGDVIEEFFPPSAAGLSATITGPDGLSSNLKVGLENEAGVGRFTATRLSGLYRMRLEGNTEQVFAVNVPAIDPGSGSESDLRRVDIDELKALGRLQVVDEPEEAVPSSESGAVINSVPKPHGPMIARLAIILALVVLSMELIFAWRWGPSKSTGVGRASGSIRPVERKWLVRLLSTTLALIPLTAAVAVLMVLFHYESTGNLLGFVPDNVRHHLEVSAGVPAAQPGEGTKWRLEGFTGFANNAIADRRVTLVLALLGVALTALVYRLEIPTVVRVTRLIVPSLLRITVLLLTLFILLPQLRLAFDREGWPEVVILLDTSGSMGTVDDLKDPAISAKAAELVGASGLSQAQRLRLAQLILTDANNDWLEKLLTQKEVKVSIFAIDSTAKSIGRLEDPADIQDGRSSLLQLTPTGESSRLGDGVEEVLKAYRGGSLAAIIMFTDGVTTDGDSLPVAAREASRAGVPLLLVGIGDTWEIPDLELTDLQAEDTITVGDRLVFDARLVSHGQVPSEPLPIVLYEKVAGQLIERGRTTATPETTGSRVPITISHTPLEAGDKTFVIAAPTIPGETNTANNRIERTVHVTESKRVRVLYVEGYPRYDFRFVKVMLERESERSLGGKGIEVEVILLNSSKGWPETDRSAFRGDFPTRDQLFSYDVVVLGDVDPKQLPRANRTLNDLADFVRIKGGGMLFLSGQHSTPAVYADTPLANILPVIPGEAKRQEVERDSWLMEGYRPTLTESGRQHPLFRLSPDVAESARIWNSLQPLYWHAVGYRRKPNTVVLAVHPSQPTEGGPAGESHPLVVQGFAGSGPVLFLGFDDTWRWRYRNDEEHFDRFWLQAIRVLSRSQVRRVDLKVTPKTDFRKNEKMTVVVRFPVEAPAPPAGQPVRVRLTREPLPRQDGTPGSGPAETTTLTLARTPGPGVQYQTILTRTPEGEYRFTLIEPETQPGIAPPSAVVRVLPALNELDRIELNKPDLSAAAAISNGGFYTLATANDMFDDMKEFERVPLNQPCPPIELWNHPAVYLLIVMLIASEWLLRKRERLL